MPNCALVEKATCDIGSRVGRKLEFPEKREAAFAPGTLARIVAARGKDETLAAFIREAVERELDRRKKPQD